MPKKGNNKRNVKKLSDSDASEGVANKKVAHVSVSDANLVNEPQLGKDTKLVIKLPPLLKRPMQPNKPENVAVKVENVQSNVENEASGTAATNLLGELKNRESTMDIAKEKIVTQEQKPPFDYWKKLEAQAQLKVAAKQGEIDFTMDDFISFDQHAVKKSANLLYGKQSELEIKNNNQVDEYEISPENILAFSGTSHFLSMMFLSDFQINGNVYKSVEHYYQASKLFALCGPTLSARLASVRKPAYVKKFVRRILAERSVPRGAVEKWKKTQGLTILNFAIHQKFGQNPSLAKRLIETEKKILAHAFDGDGYLACNADEKEILKWAEEHNGEILKIPREVNWENAENVPVVGKGKNLLGAICMKVRQELLTKHGAILGEN